MLVTLVALADTFLKLSADQAALLPANQKYALKKGLVLPIAAVADHDEYWKVTLGISNGEQMFFSGRNTWLAYKPDVRLDGYSSDRPQIRTINEKGLALLRSFEGCRLSSYCDCVGVWTIGFGTTTNVRPGMTITQQQAESFLKSDLAIFEHAVDRLVKVPLNDDQFSALVSFTYNVGAGALSSCSALRSLNQGNYADAADRLLFWNKGDNGELPGLTRRRHAERSLFLGEDFTPYI